VSILSRLVAAVAIICLAAVGAEAKKSHVARKAVQPSAAALARIPAKPKTVRRPLHAPFDESRARPEQTPAGRALVYSVDAPKRTTLRYYGGPKSPMWAAVPQ
jgi:hypothetical protein